MQAAQISVELDQNKIKEYIEEKINNEIRREVLFIDITGLVEITSCSKRWLEDELLTDPRIKQFERRKNRKRLWLYKETINAIKEIAEEW